MSKLPPHDEHSAALRSSSTPLNDLDSPVYSSPVLNVVGADRGLGQRHVDPYLQVDIPRWTRLSEGDTYEYYHGSRSVPLAFATVKSGEEDKTSFRFAIVSERVPQGFSFPVFVRVVRKGPDTPSTSEDWTVFVKKTRPGPAWTSSPGWATTTSYC